MPQGYITFYKANEELLIPFGADPTVYTRKGWSLQKPQKSEEPVPVPPVSLQKRGRKNV